MTDAALFTSARPYIRWWWFSGPIDEAVIRYQLDWVAANGFGGVEIAWVYPLDNRTLGAPWLSEEWAQPVRFAAAYAASLGLGCDFTLGSAWPFGGFHVPPADASQTYNGPSPQRLEKSWETPLGDEGGLILNHLDRHALERYVRHFGAALGLPEQGEAMGQPGLFCDSWEVLPEGLWTAGFGAAFQQRYGYDILPVMPELDAHPDQRYDYRKLIAEYALEDFYRPFTTLCHELGGYARVQCHGAPADIVAAYALADVPESEAILFDPDFATFAASAAALTGKPVVSAEAFTCVYGWEPCPGPGPHQGEERLTDLKLIADGLIANGVNQIVWHGMPYNPPGGDQRFYATTHVGPDSPLAEDFAPFNALHGADLHADAPRPHLHGRRRLSAAGGWLDGRRIAARPPETQLQICLRTAGDQAAVRTQGLPPAVGHGALPARRRRRRRQATLRRRRIHLAVRRRGVAGCRGARRPAAPGAGRTAASACCSIPGSLAATSRRGMLRSLRN